MFLCAPLWENKSEGRTHSVNLSLAGQKATRTALNADQGGIESLGILY